jgi:hypothetical protein
MDKKIPAFLYTEINDEFEEHTLWEARKPREPRLNDTTGGTAPLNRFEACNITPSPPKHATKSTFSCRSLNQ